MTFNTRVYAKWILTGEHAVLRGHPVLLFPLKNKFCDVSYQAADHPLQIKFLGEFAAAMQDPAAAALERAKYLLQQPDLCFTGTLTIENHIPVGSGLGASAALSVALTRWLHALGKLHPSKLFEFAREIENLFHGESSGADIAVNLADNGIKFFRNGSMTPLHPVWKPIWFLSASGKFASTLDCINEVKYLWNTDPDTAQKIDTSMAASVALAENALSNFSSEAFDQLAAAIELGHQCFIAWNLCNAELNDHIHTLKKSGAVSAKPIGSGKGGYVLSLWDAEPPAAMRSCLLKI